MSPHAATGARSLGLCLLVAALAACGITPSSDPTPATSASASPPVPAANPTTPTAVPGTQPPEAVLAGLAGGPVPGDLGTFAWDGFASDSPWILGPPAGSAGVGDPLRVELRPGGDPWAWQASWARVVGGQAEEPSGVRELQGGRVVLHAPEVAGPWSLQLVARLGPGREAAWYWQVEVRP